MLDDYRKKRDPRRTPEPFGERRKGPGRLFVVQKHAARRLHYDLRLEIDGTLKSWAVPRGPSLKPSERRLAVHVEDHPIEYADFEGVIPAGNYGAGSVIVWDRGWYRLIKGGAPLAELERGKLEIEFFGHKLRGAWTLVRTGGKAKATDKDWLLLKKQDAFVADEELTDRFPHSVLSGLTVEEVGGRPAALGALRARLDAVRAPAGELAEGGPPLMLATLVDRPFSGKDWLFEVKYDGVRVLAVRDARRLELIGRRGQIVTARYPEIVVALRALPLERFMIDGEIVALDESGRPSFQRLQARMHLSRAADIELARATTPATAVFFDCLAADGRILTSLPLHERKACLALFLPPRGVIRYGEHVVEHGEALFGAAEEQRLEGIVAKKLDSRYVGGRSADWLKIKCQRRGDFVIGGYTDPQGARSYFGALHLGVYDGGKLVYVSKVGTGFDGRTLTTLWEKLGRLRRAGSPFAVGTPTGRGHHWVEPVLVCEVRFTDWTNDGGIRHPAFLGLREDKKPEECRREVPVALGDSEEGVERKPTGPERAGSAPDETNNERHAVISNPQKVFWPDEGYTKSDLVAYYERVLPWLLPYLRDRPVVLTRYPDGIGGKSFYQKDAPDWRPSWIRTVSIHSDETRRDIDYFVIDDRESLRWILNLGVIPLHLWGSRAGSLERPDWLILDLDPKGAPFGDVVKVALALHRILEALELPHYVKTSGATGLHILLPLGARYTYEETRTFALLLATLGVESEPEIATIERAIRARGGKVYIDALQNGHGQTIVAPYSVRPLAGAPVSCPLRWNEVTARLDPRRFTMTTAPTRFEKLGDPITAVLGEGIDMAAALSRIR